MTKIEVTCPEGHKFWMEDTESKACPICGRLVIGPKAKKSPSGCIITTACVEVAGLPDNCNELEGMRYLRDEYLLKSDEGKRVIQDYYEIAPSIVEKIKSAENSNEIYHEIFNEIREIVSLIKTSDFENATEQYKEMMLSLKKRYLEMPEAIMGR